MRSRINATRKISSLHQGISTVTRPDPVSNIRTVRYHVDPRQSLMRCQIEARRLQATLVWNDFWTRHNTEYNRQLQRLHSRHVGQEVPDEEMSQFYADHLESTRQDHRDFNRWWIRENFALLYAGAKCWILERMPDRKEPGFFGGH